MSWEYSNYVSVKEKSVEISQADTGWRDKSWQVIWVYELNKTALFNFHVGCSADMTSWQEYAQKSIL